MWIVVTLVIALLVAMLAFLAWVGLRPTLAARALVLRFGVDQVRAALAAAGERGGLDLAGRDKTQDEPDRALLAGLKELGLLRSAALDSRRLVLSLDGSRVNAWANDADELGLPPASPPTCCLACSALARWLRPTGATS